MKLLVLLVALLPLASFSGASDLPDLPYTLSNDPNDVHFYLFPDGRNTDSYEEIVYNTPSSLESSSYDKSLKTVFVIHGFRSNVSSDMPQTVKNAFLAANLGYNVIVVSWGALSTPLPPEVTWIFYTPVTLNVPIVAKRVADFILFMRDQNSLQLKNVYLVGHSLGAHISGLTGRNIYKSTGQKVPRITGLDPGGPLFWPPSEEKNIRKENAQFVDVIHTNMFTLGDYVPDGHADFYPNGGLSQPNCLAGDNVSIDTKGRCSHWFAYRLFAASLTKKFPACKCPIPFLLSLTTYPLGQCPDKCLFPVYLGYPLSPLARGEFYLTTTNPP